MNVAGEGQAAAYGYVGSLLGVPCWTDSNSPTDISAIRTPS